MVFKLLREPDNRYKYDAILVDEAQDFVDHWWLAIIDLLKSEDSSETWLYIFYDELILKCSGNT